MRQPDQMFRLTPEVYKALEKKVASNVFVTDKTTDLQAGFALGVQHVLKALRDGYTVSSS